MQEGIARAYTVMEMAEHQRSLHPSDFFFKSNPSYLFGRGNPRMMPDYISHHVHLVGHRRLQPADQLLSLLERHWALYPPPELLLQQGDVQPQLSPFITRYHRASVRGALFRTEQLDRGKKSQNCGVVYKLHASDGSEQCFLGVAVDFFAHVPFPQLSELSDMFAVIHRVLVTGNIKGTSIARVSRPAGPNSMIDLVPLSSLAAINVVFMPKSATPDVAIRFSRED